MKKFKTIFTCMVTVNMLLFLQTTNAQINLEHTFEESVYPASSYYGDNDILINYSDNDGNRQYKLFNADYSLHKIIDISLFGGYPDGYNSFSVNNFTRKLFNDDNKIEFIVDFMNFETYSSILRIYNEDGTIIKDFGETSIFSSCTIYKIGEENKLFRFTSDMNTDSHTTEIYSLPGKISNIVPIAGNSFSQPPYPNPANSTITLPYQLRQGEISTMHIYSINGQLIESKQIDSIFDKILLNVSNYRKGIYLYEVNGESKRFIVK